jgi:hypothetical protein
MKIQISNIGPIREFEFDLERDFHLIMGTNNVGKSYAITIVYLFVKAILQSSIFPEEGLDYYLFVEAEAPLKTLIDPARKKVLALPLHTEADISTEVRDAFQSLLEVTVLPSLKESVDATFDSLKTLPNQYSLDEPTVTIVAQTASITFGITNEQFCIKSLRLKSQYNAKAILQSRQTVHKDHACVIYHNQNDSHAFDKALIKQLALEHKTFVNEVSRQVSDLHYLPASRSGLYQALSAFGQIVAELSKSRAFLRNKIELPSISEPLSDYFIKLSGITAEKRQYEGKETDLLAQEIENEIIKGRVEFDQKTKRLIYFPYGTTLRLDLSTTSSMVSELSPIVSYLRYILTRPPQLVLAGYRRRRIRPQRSQPRALLIIEEPEAHLHPENQAKITEIFAKLTKAQVKVILTSHSNYVFNKTNNLVLAGLLEPNNIQATVFKMTDKGSIGKRLTVDELGIDDENFIETAERLFDEKSDLIDKMNSA